ncbi:MAG: hypothetical protein WCP09_00530 [Candidatus Taylorbacteria bacterium]
MKCCSKKQFVSLSLLAIISVFFLTLSVSAQGIPVSDGLTITLSNERPVPGQVVTISVNSYGADISSAKISWSVNGKIVKNEIGANKIDVTAPALGSKLTIVITATTPNGTVVEGSTVIASGVVDMIVESDGYVPPLFLGKTTSAYQNSVKVIAVPHLANSSGKEYDPTKLVYKWKKAGSLIEGSSGYGKQSIIIPGSLIPRAYDLSVTVSESTGGSQAIGHAFIEPQQPSINFYVNDPLYGTLFNKAIGDSINMGSQQEKGILAVPYGFSSDTILSWLINGDSRPELNNKPSIVLRSSGTDGGSSMIRLDISSANNILQGASLGFTATFNPASDANTSSNNSLSI